MASAQTGSRTCTAYEVARSELDGLCGADVYLYRLSATHRQLHLLPVLRTST